jgi:hypothetical protein
MRRRTQHRVRAGTHENITASRKKEPMKPTLLENKGVPLERQKFTWRDLVQNPISKLDNDAYTRVRIIFMGLMHDNSVPTKCRARWSPSPAPCGPEHDLRVRMKEAVG